MDTRDEYITEARRRAALVKGARDMIHKCCDGVNTGPCEVKLEHLMMDLHNLFLELLDSNGGK